MEFNVDVLDADFEPGPLFSDSLEVSSEEFDSSEEFLDDSSEEFLDDSSEESGSVEALSSVSYDDTLLLGALDQVHFDLMLIFTVLVLLFARSCLHVYRNFILRSSDAVRR